MSPAWTKALQALMATEQVLLPIFIHNPKSQAIAGAVVVTEDIFGQAFGLNGSATPAAPAPATPPAQTAATAA